MSCSEPIINWLMKNEWQYRFILIYLMLSSTKMKTACGTCHDFYHYAICCGSRVYCALLPRSIVRRMKPGNESHDMRPLIYVKRIDIWQRMNIWYLSLIIAATIRCYVTAELTTSCVDIISPTICHALDIIKCRDDTASSSRSTALLHSRQLAADIFIIHGSAIIITHEAEI